MNKELKDKLLKVVGKYDITKNDMFKYCKFYTGSFWDRWIL